MGRNLAVGKKYESDIPSVAEYGAKLDADRKILTDGVVGSNFMWCWGYGTMWRKPVEITLDLGDKTTFGAVGLHLTEMGELLGNNLADKNKIEVLLSDDGKEFKSAGMVDMTIRLKDVPLNYMLPDDESFGGWCFYLLSDKPMAARYVRYKVRHPDFFCPSELLVREFIRYEPFDLRIALPNEELLKRP